MLKYTPKMIVKDLRRLMLSNPPYLDPDKPRIICTSRYHLPYGEKFIGKVEKLLGRPEGWNIEKIIEDNYIHLKLTKGAE